MITKYLIFLCNTIFLGHVKHASKLVCSRDEIPEKISIDTFNLKFDHYITHLGIYKEIH